MTEMRRLLGMLREDDATYTPQPGLARLPDLLENARSTGVEVEVVEVGEHRELPAGVDLVAFRVIQESLTNVRKHAGGSPARVVVSYGVREIGIEVTNEQGAAAARSTNGDGHGLIGMRERVRIFGGAFEASPRRSGGFRVRAVIPLDEDAR
jgi:signal transduction histidine kinase